MKCECKYPDGTPTFYCTGVCGSDRAMSNQVHQERAQEDAFTPRQLQQIRDIVEGIKFEGKLSSIWIDGFVKGFEEGSNS